MNCQPSPPPHQARRVRSRGPRGDAADDGPAPWAGDPAERHNLVRAAGPDAAHKQDRPEPPRPLLAGAVARGAEGGLPSLAFARGTGSAVQLLICAEIAKALTERRDGSATLHNDRNSKRPSSDSVLQLALSAKTTFCTLFPALPPAPCVSFVAPRRRSSSSRFCTESAPSRRTTASAPSKLPSSETSSVRKAVNTPRGEAGNNILTRS